MEKLKIVVGCNGNIGNYISEYELKRAEKVIGIDINEECIHSNKKNFKYLQFDCTKPNFIENFFREKFKNRSFKIRSLILAAALDSVPIEKKEDNYGYGLSSQEFHEIHKRIKVNITSQIYMLKVFEDYLYDKSHVCLFSSIYGVRSPDHNIYSNNFIKPLEYTTSKSAIIGLTKHFAVTSSYLNKGRCNCLILGGIKNHNHEEEFRKKYLIKVPLKRMASLEDVYNAYKFLDSEKAAYITGTSLTVDGGYTAL
ncbi:MAG: SDR family oxidoreductase [Prochlorococcus marinus CUG1437]|nr:SDR family oxidoreductase [Prochlorococcus marinus CUG1437]